MEERTLTSLLCSQTIVATRFWRSCSSRSWLPLQASTFVWLRRARQGRGPKKTARRGGIDPTATILYENAIRVNYI